ncbi:MAG: dTDP-4-dehydrorhamnose 3,5-epimerase family protein [Candidatus Saelkia tenebricola]|nr:dTDP-4-dehydrorhamnose 3,5-epimerase family protein [Candidatus Saelkia tenebricola]
MIQGVKIKQLHSYMDERGKLLEILRSDDDLFSGFGQVYVTTIKTAVIKGWHLHKNQIDNFCCVKGSVKLVLYDPRCDKSSYKELKEFLMGEDNLILVQIPSGVYHAMQCVGESEAVVLNIPDTLYNHKEPDKYELEPNSNEITYDWGKTD